MSQQSTTDSTTTITYRPIHLEIKPDSLSDTLNLLSFTHTFNKAAVGAVIAQKRNGRTSYTITKRSSTDFDVQAKSDGDDTTSVAKDTKTVVKTKEKVVVETTPTVLGRVLNTSKNVLIIGGLLVLLLLGLLRKITS